MLFTLCKFTFIVHRVSERGEDNLEFDEFSRLTATIVTVTDTATFRSSKMPLESSFDRLWESVERDTAESEIWRASDLVARHRSRTTTPVASVAEEIDGGAMGI